MGFCFAGVLYVGFYDRGVACCDLGGALPESVTLVAYPERDYQFFERISTKASELNTSNKSVVSIKQVKQKDTSFGKYFLYLKAQKPGTAVVSVKLKGKTYKTKVIVKKYVNPVQSVKIGSI